MIAKTKKRSKTNLTQTARRQVEEALRASEAKNLALLNAIPDMIFIHDHEGNYLDYHAPGKQLLYAPPELFLGKNIRDVMPPQMAHSYLSVVGQAIQSGKSQLFDYALDMPDGRKYFEAHIVAYQDSKILSVIRDITGRRQAERELSKQFEIQDSLYQMTAFLGRTPALEDVYETALINLQITLAADGVSILLFDEDGVMRFKAWRGVSDSYRMAADGNSLWKPYTRDPKLVLVPDVQAGPSLASLRPIFSDEGIGALGVIPLIHQDKLLGTFMIYYSSPHIFPSEEVQLAQTIANHVAFAIARKQAQDELQRANKSLETAHHELQQSLAQEQILARTDGLTALYNRRYFFELAVREFNASIRYQRPMTIILFDVDGFKHINDTFGHLLGDAVLAQVAQVTTTQVRDVDILARYGGDEFIILLPETNAQHAFLTAERIRLRVDALKVEADNDPFMVTLSIGVAELVHSPRDRSVEDVIRKADKALYMAKKNGRDHTIIYKEI